MWRPHSIPVGSLHADHIGTYGPTTLAATVAVGASEFVTDAPGEANAVGVVSDPFVNLYLETLVRRAPASGNDSDAVHAELSADQARALAVSLTEAADILDGLAPA